LHDANARYGRTFVMEIAVFYAGIDPTADFTHYWTFGRGMMLRIFQLGQGTSHMPLIGGATGMIGDPFRNLQSVIYWMKLTLAHNQAAIKRHKLSRFLNFNSGNDNSAHLG